MRVCVDCHRLTEQTRCDSCRKAKRRESDKRRPSASERGYGSAWAKRRKEFLRYFPICIDCGAEATVPDHDPLTRNELIAQGVSDPDAFEYLRPRCASCHSRKTVKQDSGFGRERGEP